MTIYIDLVIILTIVVHVLIVITINLSFNCKTKLIPLVLSSFVACFFLIIYIIPNLILIKLRLVYGIIIGLIAFINSSRKVIIKKILTYYMLNFIFIGSLAIFKVHNHFMLISILLIWLLIYIILTITKSKCCEVELSLNNHHLFCLIDTGNNVYYKSQRVVFLDNKYYSNKFKLIGTTIINTTIANKVINVYDGPQLKGLKNLTKCVYSFVEINRYDVILHQAYMEEISK